MVDAGLQKSHGPCDTCSSLSIITLLIVTISRITSTQQTWGRWDFVATACGPWAQGCPWSDGLGQVKGQLVIGSRPV